jgi:hypothetical protein
MTTLNTHIDLAPTGPFYKLDNNPIFSGGSYLPENIVFDGSTTYWMIFSNFTANTLGIASSPDLLTWTVVNANLITAIGTGAAPHLMLDGGSWHIFYSKVGTGGKTTLFHTSAAAASGPYGSETEVLTCGAAGAWDRERVMESYVFKDDDGIYKMFYMGDASPAASLNPLEQVGLATAPALTGPWTKAAANPVIPFGAAGSFDASVVADPHVVKVNGTYYIFYAAVGAPHGSAQTALVTSIDLVTFTKQGIVLPSGPLGSIDSAAAARGAITLAGDKYYFPYAGWDGGATFKPCMAIASARAAQQFVVP